METMVHEPEKNVMQFLPVAAGKPKIKGQRVIKCRKYLLVGELVL